MVKKKVTKSRAAPKVATAQPANNQDMAIAVIVIILVLAILAFLIFQPQIMPEQTPNEKDCTPINYYETITVPANVETSTPYNYEITYEWEGIPGDSYSAYNPNNFYVKQTREVKNLESSSGEFTVTCSFTTAEDGLNEISQTNTISANTTSTFNTSYKITPGETVTYGGCVITPAQKLTTTTGETTEQVMKTKLPDGC